jgi:hypothetical protein
VGKDGVLEVVDGEALPMTIVGPDGREDETRQDQERSGPAAGFHLDFGFRLSESKLSHVNLRRPALHWK